ncbi:MAG: RNA-binding S4 domain-containing protein [Prolixibacteraceae bacterium]|jgi:ribosome-associated heat shock protein Hsp15|nr:RNA-binding S4 domain-containing protein [Prolixibacteraceae bacterium]
MEEQVRIDKWLWAVRVFKTRSIAAEAIKKGRVTVNGHPIKSSKTVKVGDTVQVKKQPVTYSFKVVGIIGKRVGAKLVPDYMKDVTPDSELEILKTQRYVMNGVRDRGTGRPTKKERRDIDHFQDLYDPMEEDDF